MDQDTFRKIMLQEAERNLDKQLYNSQQQVYMAEEAYNMTKTPKRQTKPRLPRWFIDIPKESPKWICTLHSSVPLLCENWDEPGSSRSCCPHVQERINNSSTSFVVTKVNNHDIIKTYANEIAELLGTSKDINGYELAANNVKDAKLFDVVNLKQFKIVQPIKSALRNAHKLGYEASFTRYGEIMLQLATQAQAHLTSDHEHLFNRFDKLRNLALRGSGGEKFVAAERAWETGRKLIDNLVEAINGPKQQDIA